MIGKEESIEEYKSRINKAILFIDNNISGKINLEDLAKAAYFSPFHFHRLFTALIGETPNDFVNRIRVEKAAHMLLYRPALTITDVALKCGFSSSAVFSRSFKQYYQTSPTQYRNSKICKTDSKIWESGKIIDDYFSPPKNRSRGKEMNVEIKEMPEFHVAFVPNLEGYITDKIEAAWNKLCMWAQPRGIIKPDTKFIGISFDDPAITDVNKCRYYACSTVPDDIAEEKAIGIMNIKKGLYAVYRFTGYADDIENAYKSVYSDFLPASGYQPSDEYCYEIYIEEPKGDPAEFVMDICIPVEPL